MSGRWDDVGARLAAVATDEVAAKTRKQVAPLRGVRGVPTGDLARLLSGLASAPPLLPDDEEALSALFATAWEDGLVAIGLLALAVPVAPEAALALAFRWAAFVDDVVTVDALGRLVVGPAIAALGPGVGPCADLREDPRPLVRRLAVAAALAWVPEVVEGPAAAGLRAATATPRLRLVEVVDGERVGAVARRFARDAAPEIQKPLRHLLRAWAKFDPDGVAAWAPTVPGGLPKLLGAEVPARPRARRST